MKWEDNRYVAMQWRQEELRFAMRLEINLVVSAVGLIVAGLMKGEDEYLTLLCFFLRKQLL